MPILSQKGQLWYISERRESLTSRSAEVKRCKKGKVFHVSPTYGLRTYNKGYFTYLSGFAYLRFVKLWRVFCNSCSALALKTLQVDSSPYYDYSRTCIKGIPLFCTAHPLLRITLRHSRWRRFLPLARKEQTRAAFAELKLLFAIIMPEIDWQLPGLLSKNKKMKEMCVIPKSAVVFHFAAVELWNY